MNDLKKAILDEWNVRRIQTSRETPNITSKMMSIEDFLQSFTNGSDTIHSPVTPKGAIKKSEIPQIANETKVLEGKPVFKCKACPKMNFKTLKSLEQHRGSIVPLRHVPARPLPFGFLRGDNISFERQNGSIWQGFNPAEGGEVTTIYEIRNLTKDPAYPGIIEMPEAILIYLDIITLQSILDAGRIEYNGCFDRDELIDIIRDFCHIAYHPNCSQLICRLTSINSSPEHYNDFIRSNASQYATKLIELQNLSDNAISVSHWGELVRVNFLSSSM
jgi:hypothetical protein